MSGFSSLSASRPYAWPLAGGWDDSDTALLMIDLQRDFLDPEGYFARLGEDTGHGRRVLAPARRLLAAARRAGLRVIHTREGHRPDLSDLNDTKRLRAESAAAAIGSTPPTEPAGAEPRYSVTSAASSAERGRENAYPTAEAASATATYLAT